MGSVLSKVVKTRLSVVEFDHFHKHRTFKCFQVHILSRNLKPVFNIDTLSLTQIIVICLTQDDPLFYVRASDKQSFDKISRIFVFTYFCIQVHVYVVACHQIRLSEVPLCKSNNICFRGNLRITRQIILLSGAVRCTTQLVHDAVMTYRRRRCTIMMSNRRQNVLSTYCARREVLI